MTYATVQFDCQGAQQHIDSSWNKDNCPHYNSMWLKAKIMEVPLRLVFVKVDPDFLEMIENGSTTLNELPHDLDLCHLETPKEAWLRLVGSPARRKTRAT